MKSRAGLYSVLACVAMLAWALFILGCLHWTAWSPDSSKVLFPYADPHANSMGIALYDRKSKRVAPVFVESIRQDSDDGAFLQPQWADIQKNRVIVSRFKKPDLDIIVWSFDRGIPIRDVHVGQLEAFPVGPFPQLDGALYLASGQVIVRLDLVSGSVRTSEPNSGQEKKKESKESEDVSGTRLFRAGNEILYARAAPDSKSEEEIGKLDLTKLTLEPLFRIPTENEGIQILLGPAIHPNGLKFAIVSSGKDEDVDKILILNLKGLVQTLTIQGLPKQARLGNLQWSKDGKTMYAAVLNPLGDSARQYSLAELSLDGKVNRITALCRVTNKDDDFQSALEISLSPDGKTIATTLALLDADYIAEGDRALFLVNVKGEQRTVTKILAPISKAEPAQPEEK